MDEIRAEGGSVRVPGFEQGRVKIDQLVMIGLRERRDGRIPLRDLQVIAAWITPVGWYDFAQHHARARYTGLRSHGRNTLHAQMALSQIIDAGEDHNRRGMSGEHIRVESGQHIGACLPAHANIGAASEMRTQVSPQIEHAVAHEDDGCDSGLDIGDGSDWWRHAVAPIVEFVSTKSHGNQAHSNRDYSAYRHGTALYHHVMRNE